MEKVLKINLIDNLISHSLEEQGYYSFTPYLRKPRGIEYVGPFSDFNGISLFTDNLIHPQYISQVESRIKVGMIHEGRSVHPDSYVAALISEGLLDCILTHDPSLLKISSKFIHFGAESSRVRDEDSGVWPKSQLCSMICSDAQFTPGHKFRSMIASIIQSAFPKIDLWGSAYRPFDLDNKPSKDEPLKDYMFSVTVMNGKHDGWWTETLIDNFRLGTIPIFWGADNVGEFFNPAGIINFNTWGELKNILNELTPEHYYSRLHAIEDNFNKVKDLACLDERLATKLIDLFGNDAYLRE